MDLIFFLELSVPSKTLPHAAKTAIINTIYTTFGSWEQYWSCCGDGVGHNRRDLGRNITDD